MEPYQCLAGSRPGIREVSILENARPTVLVEKDRFHGTSLWGV